MENNQTWRYIVLKGKSYEKKSTKFRMCSKAKCHGENRSNWVIYNQGKMPW